MSVYNNDSVFNPEVLDLTAEGLMEKFAAGVSHVTPLSLVVSYLTQVVASWSRRHNPNLHAYHS